MNSSLETRPVLVAVANPDHVEQLVRTASDVARCGDGHVKIVSVVVKPHTSPFSVYSDQAIVERFAQDTQDVLDAATAVAPDDVSIEREVLVGRSVASGILTATRQTDTQALVVGWHGRRTRTESILGSNLDQLIKYAPSDLYVERVGDEANGVDSILVPVAGGPHVRPAVAAAKAIAARNDATVHVLSVGTTNENSDSACDHIETAVMQLENAPGPDVAVETRLAVGDDTTDVIVEAAVDHDILIFGVTRQSVIRRRLVGSIPQRVIPRTDGTVVLARSVDVVEKPTFDRLRRLWRRS